MTNENESGNELLEKKKDVEVLREAVMRLKLLSDAAFEAIFLSEKGICIDQNQTAEKLFGYSLQEAVGRHGAEWIVPEDREVVRSKMLLEQTALYEVTALRKDGTTFPCEIQARDLNLDGRTLRVTSLRDISERRQAEEMRENLQAQLANSIEMAHLGPWEYDAVQDIFIFNDYFYKMFRTTAEQVGGYTMRSDQYARRFVHPDDHALVGEEVRKALETDDPLYSRQLEHRILYADGAEGYITVRFFIQKDASGKTVRTYGVNQDITSRKLSEEALRGAADRAGRGAGQTTSTPDDGTDRIRGNGAQADIRTAAR
jgi:PAS domain S-box-containing protein